MILHPISSRKNLFTVFLTLLYLTAAFLIVQYIIQGYDYYLTPLAERPRHTVYTNLKPGGLLGHGYGIAGGTMILLLLFYSLRKRVKVFRNIGILGHWLNLHIFLGIIGPVFIVLHSSLKLNGLAAVGFWAMVIVALSGIFGRYLYLQIPRNIAGQELSLSDLQQQGRNYYNELKQDFKLSDETVRKIEDLFSALDLESRGVWSALWAMLRFSLTRGLRFKTLSVHIRSQVSIPPMQMKTLVRLSRRQLLLQHRIHFWNQIHTLFDYWHVFHKPFAVILYLIMLVHISISLWLGYAWIF